MTDDLPSRGTCNTPSFPTISVYYGLEQNTLEKILEILKACNFIKKRLWQRYFSVNFAKRLRTPFVTEHLWMTASEPNSMKLHL